MHVSLDSGSAFLTIIAGSVLLFNTLPSRIRSNWLIARKCGLRWMLQLILTAYVLGQLIYVLITLGYPLTSGGEVAAPVGSIGAWFDTIAFNLQVASHILFILWVIWYILVRGLRTAVHYQPPHEQPRDP